MKLSNYGASILEECERKFVHQYIWKTAKDPDAETDSHALNYGTVMHGMLEFVARIPRKFEVTDTLDVAVFEDIWNRLINDDKEIKKIYETLDLSDQAKIYVACNNFLRWRGAQPEGTKLFLEQEIETDFCRARLDLIVVYPDGKWWIMDHKSTSTIFGGSQDLKILQAPHDPQLRLYAMLAKYIPKIADVNDFQGVGFLEYHKTKHTQTKNDSHFTDIVERMFAKDAQMKDHFRMICVEKEEMDIEEFAQNYLAQHKRAIELNCSAKDLRSSRQNRRSCVNSYGQVCAYFSHCHNGQIKSAQQKSADKYVSAQKEEANPFDF